MSSSKKRFYEHLREKSGLSRNGVLLGFESGVALNAGALVMLPFFASNLYSLGILKELNTLHCTAMFFTITFSLFSILNFTLSSLLKTDWYKSVHPGAEVKYLYDESIKDPEYLEHIINNKPRKYLVPMIFASCILLLPFMIGGYSVMADYCLSRPYIESPWITSIGSIVISAAVIFNIAETALYCGQEASEYHYV